MQAFSTRTGWGVLRGLVALTVASCTISAAMAQDASVTADLSALRAKYGNALADRVINEFMPMRRRILAEALNPTRQRLRSEARLQGDKDRAHLPARSPSCSETLD
jgi:hypothetical protein